MFGKRRVVIAPEPIRVSFCAPLDRLFGMSSYSGTLADFVRLYRIIDSLLTKEGDVEKTGDSQKV